MKLLPLKTRRDDVVGITLGRTRKNLFRAAIVCCIGFLCIHSILTISEANKKLLGSLKPSAVSNGITTSSEKTSNSLIKAARTTQPPSVAPASIQSRKQDLFSNNSASASETRTTHPPSVAPTSSQLREENPFAHFLMHIPKTGSSHAYSQMNQMAHTYTDVPQFLKKRVCNEGTNLLGDFYQFRKTFKGEECNLWMSEQPYSTKPERVYAILRDPRSHTLSMYFHCKESKDHARRAHKMPPSVDDWLKGWVDVKQNANSSVSIIDEQFRLSRKWACYNPINFQTRWIGHPQPNIEKISHDVFYPSYSNQYKVSAKDLRERYLVLGDQAQMDKSICTIYAHYRGYVTEACDCTNATVVADNDDGNVSTYLNQSTAGGILDHGVAHHGDTYKTTPEQDAMIEFLRDRDTVLYKKTQKIFAEQVREIEEKHGVKICDKMKPLKKK